MAGRRAHEADEKLRPIGVASAAAGSGSSATSFESCGERIAARARRRSAEAVDRPRHRAPLRALFRRHRPGDERDWTALETDDAPRRAVRSARLDREREFDSANAPSSASDPAGMAGSGKAIAPDGGFDCGVERQRRIVDLLRQRQLTSTPLVVLFGRRIGASEELSAWSISSSPSRRMAPGPASDRRSSRR